MIIMSCEIFVTKQISKSQLFKQLTLSIGSVTSIVQWNCNVP